MKGGMFGSGPPTTSGSRVFWRAGEHPKANVATGKARGDDSPTLPLWMADPGRACADKPTAWWFAPEEDEWGDKVTTREDSERAEALCRTCPFVLPCREYGLANERFGRWGGIRVDNLKVGQRRDLLARVQRQLRRPQRRPA